MSGIRRQRRPIRRRFGGDGERANCDEGRLRGRRKNGTYGVRRECGDGNGWEREEGEGDEGEDDDDRGTRGREGRDDGRGLGAARARGPRRVFGRDRGEDLGGYDERARHDPRDRADAFRDGDEDGSNDGTDVEEGYESRAGCRCGMCHSGFDRKCGRDEEEDEGEGEERAEDGSENGNGYDDGDGDGHWRGSEDDRTIYGDHDRDAGMRRRTPVIQDPKSLFPDAAKEAAMTKRAAALNQMEEEGNHRGNGDGGPELTHTKGLPHDRDGVCDPQAFATLVEAIASRDPKIWASVPLGWQEARKRKSEREGLGRGKGKGKGEGKGSKRKTDKIEMTITKLPRTDVLRLDSPLAAWSFEMEGPASCTVGLPPAPTARSAMAAADMVECYEMALSRDSPFAEYACDPHLRRSGRRLSLCGGYVGPRDGSGKVSHSVVFRGPTRGDLRGPYVSQFLLQPFPSASTVVDQMYESPMPGTDWMSDWGSALMAQNGIVPHIDGARRAAMFSRIPRYVRNGRDLAWLCGSDDYPTQVFVNAALILKAMGCPLNPCNPYRRKSDSGSGVREDRGRGRSRTRAPGTDRGGCGPTADEMADAVENQNNLVHLGLADAVDAISKVGAVALKAAWYHKWCVHTRPRPEAMGMLVEKAWRTKDNDHDLHSDLLGSPTLKAVERRQGTLLLSQVFPSGAPCSPSYPCGHATVASACACVLKAFFDGEWVIPDAVDADSEGTVLRRMAGVGDGKKGKRDEAKGKHGRRSRNRERGGGTDPDGVEGDRSVRLTAGDEIDKLASNVGMARCFAGVASRSDVEAGWELGEKVAVRTLHDLCKRYAEPSFEFRFRSREGLAVRIDGTD